VDYVGSIAGLLLVIMAENSKVGKNGTYSILGFTGGGWGFGTGGGA